MIIDIGNIIINKIKDLSFIDKYAGVVRPATKTDRDSDNKVVRKTFPIACNVIPTECDDGTYMELCPDSKKKSVVYLEDSPIAFLRREKNTFHFRGRFDLVVWLNLPMLGKTDCSVSSKVLMSIIAAFPDLPFHSGIFQSINISVLGQDQKTRNPFQKYSYDEATSQFLLYPFDYLVIPIQVDFAVNKKCLDSFEVEAPLACQPVPRDPLTIYDFCTDAIFDRLTDEQKFCLTQRLCSNMEYKSIPFTGAIDGVNKVFTCADEIEQIFLNGQLIYEGELYTLDVTRKIATLTNAPEPAPIDDKLKFYGNAPI